MEASTFDDFCPCLKLINGSIVHEIKPTQLGNNSPDAFIQIMWEKFFKKTYESVKTYYLTASNVLS